MSTAARELLERALQLTDDERAGLVTELLASLDPDVETRSDEDWIREIERRAQAAVAGEAGLSWDETRTRIKERLSRPPT